MEVRFTQRSWYLQYLGDADDTKKGSLILNPSTGSVQVRLDCIKLELSDQMLHSYYDSRLRLSDTVQGLKLFVLRMPKLTLNLYLSWKMIFQWAPCVFLGKIWMDSHRMEVPVVERAMCLLQVFLFLKMQKFLTAQKCTYLRKNCTKCHAKAPALCLLVYLTMAVCITTRGPKSSHEAKITVGNALKTPEAPYWVEVLNTEIKQLIDTGTLRAVKLSDVPANASLINFDNGFTQKA